MTQSDFSTKYGRIAMPMPFAGATGAALASIAHTSGSVVNFPDGFPQNYSAPHSKGGKYITRGEMNAIGHLATVEGFYRQCGGLNLFDQEFCTCIGGYPKGAVLDYLVGNKLTSIISLRDNNDSNPYDGAIDGVNWMYLNRDSGDLENVVPLGIVSCNTGIPMSISPLQILRAKSNGILSLSNAKWHETNLATRVITYENITRRLQANIYNGTMLLYKNIGNDPTTIDSITYPTNGNLNEWKQLAIQGFGADSGTGVHDVTFHHEVISGGGGGFPIDSNTVSNSAITQGVPFVNAGDYIAFCLIVGNFWTPSVRLQNASASISSTTATADVVSTYTSLCTNFEYEFSILQ